MAKYSYEFKMNVVREYLKGEGGYESLAKRHGVDHKMIQRWVNAYKIIGEAGLKRSRKNKEYSFEFKMHVVELYLEGEFSYQQLALQLGMNNPSLIARWVSEYRTAGIDALKPKKKGRHRTMDEEKVAGEIKCGDDEEKKELIQKLQDENLRLRIENAFLKESRRLRMEEETLQKELRESYTASEKNSD